MALVKLRHKISGRTATLNDHQVASARELGFIPVDELEQEAPTEQESSEQEQEQEEATSSEAQAAAESEEEADAEPASDDDAELASKTNAELRELLEAHGLSTEGNKADLVARLESVE